MQDVELIPDSFQHTLAARGVPTIPSDVFGDGVVDRYLAERLIKLRALTGIIPVRLFDVILAPILVGDLLCTRRGVLFRRMIGAVIVDKVGRISREERRPLAIH